MEESVGALRKYALDLNRKQSQEFSAPDARLSRQLYREQYPTEIIALKCMDGRLNLSVMTQSPPGIIKPYRNIGGRFNLGWPFFGELINEDVEEAIVRKRDVLVFVTYHFSRGDTHRGCAGFGYDTEGAKQAASDLLAQFEEVFGKKQRVVHPILVGIETDEDALVFYGAGGASLDMSAAVDYAPADLEHKLVELYPDMREGMRRSLTSLVAGNQRRVREVRGQNRPPIDLEHRENIIGVGRGFYWLHQPNKALIVGPYGSGWPSAIAKAGSIILDNIRAGRAEPKDGVLLLVSTLARAQNGSHRWNIASQKARYLEEEARAALRDVFADSDVPLIGLTGVVDADTLLLHPLD